MYRSRVELLTQSSNEFLYPYPPVLILPKSLLESQVNLPMEKINFQKIQGRKSHLQMCQLQFQGLQEDCRKI